MSGIGAFEVAGGPGRDRRRYLVALFVVLLLVSMPACLVKVVHDGGSAAPAVRSLVAEAGERLDAVQAWAQARRARVSLVLVDRATGERVGLDENEQLLTASVAKLFIASQLAFLDATGDRLVTVYDDALLGPMLSASDDVAATVLWGRERGSCTRYGDRCRRRVVRRRGSGRRASVVGVSVGVPPESVRGVLACDGALVQCHELLMRGHVGSRGRRRAPADRGDVPETAGSGRGGRVAERSAERSGGHRGLAAAARSAGVLLVGEALAGLARGHRNLKDLAVDCKRKDTAAESPFRDRPASVWDATAPRRLSGPGHRADDGVQRAPNWSRGKERRAKKPLMMSEPDGTIGA